MTISAPRLSASSRATPVLPTAVGLIRPRTLLFSHACHNLNYSRFYIFWGRGRKGERGKISSLNKHQRPAAFYLGRGSSGGCRRRESGATGGGRGGSGWRPVFHPVAPAGQRWPLSFRTSPALMAPRQAMNCRACSSTAWGEAALFKGGQNLHRFGHHRLQVGAGQKGRHRGDQKAGPAEIGERQADLGQNLQMLRTQSAGGPGPPPPWGRAGPAGPR